jgi:hypothetical protein
MVRVLAVVAVLVAACAPAQPPTPLTRADQVQAHRLQWNAAHIRNYAFTYRDRCFCPGSFVWVRITVNNGSVTQAELTDTTSYGFRRTSEFRRPTIDSLFVWIADAYNRQSDRIEVRYDSKFHFPTYAAIDWKLNMIDDEFTFEARDFTTRDSPR